MFCADAHANFADVHAADGDRAVISWQVVQPVEQIHHGGFSASGRAQDTDRRTGLYSEAYIFQHGVYAVVVKRDVLENDVTGKRRTFGIRRILFLLRVENFFQTRDGNAGFAHFG